MEDKIKNNEQVSSNVKKRRRKKTSSHSRKNTKIVKKTKKRKINKIIISCILGLGVLSGIYFYTQHKPEAKYIQKNEQNKNTDKKDSNIIQFEKLNTDQKNEIIAAKLNSNPLLEGWSNEEVQILKGYISKYSINKNFVEKSTHHDVGIFSLMNNKDTYSNILNEKEILLEKTGYPLVNTTGVFINQKGFVTSVLPDSPAYLSGIRKNWQLFNVNNYNKPFFSSDYRINDNLLSKSNSVWRNPNNQYFNFNPIQTYPAIGAIATGTVQNHILNIQIKEMSKATPGRIYSIIQSTLSKNQIKGILIDLRISADSLNGIQETTWILNGGHEDIIAIATNNKNENFQIMAKKPSFDLDNNVINFINKTKKIIVVNKETKGLSEALVYNLEKNNSLILGNETSGKTTIETNFIIGSKGAEITTYNFQLPNNIQLPLKPKSSIDFSILDNLYSIQQY